MRFSASEYRADISDRIRRLVAVEIAMKEDPAAESDRMRRTLEQLDEALSSFAARTEFSEAEFARRAEEKREKERRAAEEKLQREQREAEEKREKEQREAEEKQREAEEKRGVPCGCDLGFVLFCLYVIFAFGSLVTGNVKLGVYLIIGGVFFVFLYFSSKYDP